MCKELAVTNESPVAQPKTNCEVLSVSAEDVSVAGGGEQTSSNEGKEETDSVVCEQPPSPQFKLGSQYRTLYRQLQQTEVQ